MSNPKPEIHVVEDPQELAQVAAGEFKRLANLAVESKGSFNVALSGGSTPEAMFDLLKVKKILIATPRRLSIPLMEAFFGFAISKLPTD